MKMDPDLVYIKTPAGEEAVLQRTRVIQRNVRMVLILVDGQSTVADLSRKTGNPQLTENALGELEKGGFVVPRVEQDSLWEESKRVAQAIRSGARQKAAKFASPLKNGKAAETSSAASGNFATGSDVEMAGMPISLHSIFEEAAGTVDFAASQFSLVSEDPPLQNVMGRDPEKREAPALSRRDDVQEKSERPVARRSFLSQIRSIWAGARRDAEEESCRVTPMRRRSRSPITWPVAVLLCFGGAIGIIVLASLFFPFSLFVPDVEAALAHAVGRPAKVGAVRVELYPAQALVLENVRIGAPNEAFDVNEIRLFPDARSIFADRFDFRRAVASGIEMPLGSIVRLPDVYSALRRPGNRFGVEEVRFQKVVLSFGGIVLKDVESEIKGDRDGRFDALVVRSADRNMTMVARPVGNVLDFDIDAYGWQPFQNGLVVFDSASLKGRLENGALAVREFDWRVLDGVVKGQAMIRPGERPAIEGEMRFERINAARLGDALGAERRLQGEVSGNVRFSAALADTWESLSESMDIDGEFTVLRGRLVGVDLAEAARRVSGSPVRGGATAFEQLSGRMKRGPDRVRFYNLVMNSGLMQSTGHVDVLKGRRLDGRLELQMKGSVNQMRVPVTISGTIDSPSAFGGTGG